MKPLKLSDRTRSLPAPSNWNEEAGGPCETLDIYDYEDGNGNVMVSAWLPNEEELQALANGAILYLHIHGTAHPVVALSIQGV